MVVVTSIGHHRILASADLYRSRQGSVMDEELRQLDLAIAEARRLATAALDALVKPQAALTSAAVEYIGSVAQRRVDAARGASVEVMAKLSDRDIAELRFWTEEQVAAMRAEVEREIESCDFWIAPTPGMSPTDVNGFGAALMPRPKDSASGIPQSLVFLFERCLHPLRRGLAVAGLAVAPAEAEPALEVALVRAWRVYREAAVVCLAKWADVDERYQASSARFQEMRWELAGEADLSELKAQRAADAVEAERSIVEEAAMAAALAAAADAELGPDEPVPDDAESVQMDAVVRGDSETLVPVPS